MWQIWAGICALVALTGYGVYQWGPLAAVETVIIIAVTIGFRWFTS